MGHIPRWKEKLDLSDVWESQTWTNENVQQLGVIVAKRIKKLKAYDEDDWIFYCDCVERFENIYPYQEYIEDIGSGFDLTPTEDFDVAMMSLYDWADDNRVWVNK